MITAVLTASQESIDVASEALRSGQVVAIPTETVYGLAANAFSDEACAQIFEAKERPHFDPLIVHTHHKPQSILWSQILTDRGLIGALRAREQAQLDRLGERFWPGPLTLVMPKSKKIPDLVTSGLSTVAIRVPDHPQAQALLFKLELPLAAPSANRFGRLSPTSAADVLQELEGRIPLILDGGPCARGIESTILLLGPERVQLLRPGSLPVEEIEACLGEAIDRVPPANAVSPGLLENHYAPTSPLILFRDGRLRSPLPPGSPDETRVIWQEKSRSSDFFPSPPKAERVLSASGDALEAARSLFRSIRELDGGKGIWIFAETRAEEMGLGFAINDRLKKASYKS